MADLVRNRTEEEAAGARHAFVANHQQVEAGSRLDQAGGGVALAGRGADLDWHWAEASEFCVEYACGALGRPDAHDRELGLGRLRDLDGPIDGPGRGGGPVGTDKNAF